jgi:endonuclease YncB( thermonuclease family)
MGSRADSLNSLFDAMIEARAIAAGLAIFFVTVLASIQSSNAESITGRASIIDGDTVEIYGTRIRLWGIDAPEHDQLCRGDDVGFFSKVFLLFFEI